MLHLHLRFCLPVVLIFLFMPRLAPASSLEERLQNAAKQAEANWGIGPSEAKSNLYAVLSEAKQRRKRTIEAGARIALGRVQARRIDSIGALAHLELAEELLGSSPSAEQQASLAQARGEALRADGQMAAARQSSQRALDLSRTLDDGAHLEAFARLELARLDTFRGDLDAAVEHARTAAERFHELNETRHARQADLETAKLLQRLGRYREAASQLKELTEQSLITVDHEAIQTFLHELLNPPDSVSRAGENIISGLQSGEKGQVLAGVVEGLLGGKKRRQGRNVPRDRQQVSPRNDPEHQKRRQRLETKLSDGGTKTLWSQDLNTWHAVPTSPHLGERLVEDCAAIRQHLEANDQTITQKLEASPGYQHFQTCFEGQYASPGRLPDGCSPYGLGLQQAMWQVSQVIPEICGSRSKFFSTKKIQEHYRDLGVVEFPPRSARQQMLQIEGFGAEDWMALNPFGAHMQDVERRHAETLEVLFDVALEAEVWNALGHAYEAFSPDDAASAFAKAWKKAQVIWTNLPDSLGFFPEQFEHVRSGGLPFNTFQRHQESLVNLSWSSFVFDASRLALMQGQFHQEQGDELMAAAFFHRSLTQQLMTAAHLANPDVELAARVGLARSFVAMERPAVAALYLQSAVELADLLRDRLDTEGSATSFANVQSEAYRELVDLLIDLGDPDLAFRYAETARARTFLEQLERRTPGDGAAPVLPLEFVRDQVLEDGTSLIAYFVTPRRVVAWVMESGASHFVELPDAKEALAEAASLLDDLEQGGSTDALERLDAALLKPLEALAQHERWIVVPHGALHQVPFAALMRSEGSETSSYLVERRRLSLLPSVSALPLVQSLRHDDPEEGHRALVLGNPGRDLPAAEEEATAVAQLYGGEALLREAATESSLYGAATSMDIVHLAAHGVIDMGHSRSSYVELAPDPEGDNGEDGRLELHEVLNRLRLPTTNLVVLSACRSGRGQRGEADDVVSLPWAFLHAGTPSVVSTLWEVEDAPSASLMQRFHTLLRQGTALDEALRQAQLDALREEATADPYYWAGFTLTGDAFAWGTPPPRVAPPAPPQTRQVPERWTGPRPGQRPVPGPRRSLPDNWPGLESSGSGGQP